MTNGKYVHLVWAGMLSAIVMTGCRTIQTPAVQPAAMQQADTTVLPTFSPEVLYVLGYEWELLHDPASAKYDTERAAKVRADSLSMGEYIEQRLVELYPERAYQGYVGKVEAVCEELLRRSYEKSSIPSAILAELPVWMRSRDDENAGYTETDSIGQTVADVMEFTPKEQAHWSALNRIAEQAEWADRAAFDTLHVSSLEEENLLLSVLLWRGPRLFYRVVQSKVRAENVARYYYGEETNSGKPGDAFKHIYVNVLLRSYTSAGMAWLVMDMYWENVHPNAPCDHYMDLHNNIVGRHTYYDTFVHPAEEQQCGEARQWLLWAEQVQRFVQDTLENSAFQQWDKTTPQFVVEPAARSVSTDKYIYWDRQTK